MKSLFLFTWALTLVCLTFIVGYAQTHVPKCATSPLSDEFLQLVRNAAQTNKPGSARLRAAPTRIAIKATLLVGSTGTPPQQAILDTALVYLNNYFMPLDIRFYWLGQANVVRDDKYANTFDLNALSATRAIYDVDNAINLYFGLVSANGNGRSFASSLSLTVAVTMYTLIHFSRTHITLGSMCFRTLYLTSLGIISVYNIRFLIVIAR